MNKENLPFVFRIYEYFNYKLPDNLKLSFQMFSLFLYKKFVKHCRSKGMKDPEIMLTWTMLTFLEVTNEYISSSHLILEKYYNSIKTNNYDEYFKEFDKYNEILMGYLNDEI